MSVSTSVSEVQEGETEDELLHMIEYASQETLGMKLNVRAEEQFTIGFGGTHL